MTKKLSGSYQYGVYVSAKTKEEFKKNKEKYKNEDINSAYALQIQKDIDRRIRQMETREKSEGVKKAIKEAFKRDYKLQTLEYTPKQIFQMYKKIEKYNKKIEIAKSKGQILRETETLTFPLNKETSKINTDRLSKAIEIIKNTEIEDIKKEQYNELIENLKYIFDDEFVKDFKVVSQGLSIQKIKDIMGDYEVIDFVATYSISDFKENVKNEYWSKYKIYKNLFYDEIFEEFIDLQPIEKQNKIDEYFNQKNK